jgi:hypothetical protein
MAISVIQGQNYTIQDGLSPDINYWYVVGKTNIPMIVDSVLGWNNGADTVPTYTQEEVYVAVIAANDSGTWIPNGQDCYFIPTFAVTNVVSYDNLHIPQFVRGKIYIDSYELSVEEYDLCILDINTSPVRIDSNLGWRDPLSNEIPTFIPSSVAVATGATYLGPWTQSSGNYTSPVFSFSKIYGWINLSDSSGSGIQGYQGPTGFLDTTGFQGYYGIQGYQGPIGSTGIQGTQGLIGLSGLQGNQGFVGSDGTQGYQGLLGPQGYKGNAGSNGSPGVRGLQGNQGPQGSLGYQGTKGNTGSQGIQGNQGFRGFQGLGVQGYRGYPGNPGPQGITGLDGLQGNQGPQGTGKQGSKGVSGAQGFQGPQSIGPQGIAGAQGFQGARGCDGIDGGSGTSGAQGAIGPQGTSGIQGSQGDWGPGLTSGGVQGQVLLKRSSTDYDTYWGDATYTNLNPTTIAVGGVPLGSTFSNVTVQNMFNELFYPYIAPTFNTFYIQGQTVNLEVGQYTLANPTFIWAENNSQNVEANSITIRDNTAGINIFTNIANTGTHGSTYSAYTKTTQANNQYVIYGTDIKGDSFNTSYYINWYWKAFYGTSGLTGMTAGDIQNLANNFLASGFANTYSYPAGNYKYLCYPNSLGSPTTATGFKDTSTNLAVAMADNTQGSFFNNVQNGWYYGLVNVTNSRNQTTQYRVYRSLNILGGSINIAVS